MLRIYPECADTWQHLSAAANHIDLLEAMPDIADLLVHQIPKGTMANNYILQVALQIALKRNAALGPLYVLCSKEVSSNSQMVITLGQHTHEQSIHLVQSEYDLTAFLKATHDSLLLSILTYGFVPTNTFESFVRILRYYMAYVWAQQPNECSQAGMDYLDLVAALGHYLFLCEYLPDVQAEEKQWHACLLGACEKLSNGAPLDMKTASALALLACYQPLDSLPVSEFLYSMACELGHPAFLSLIEQTCENLLQEKRRMKSIQQFGSIGDHVSQVVREQYEENPYPRWKKINTEGKPYMNPVRMVYELFPKSATYNIQVPDAHDSLIAGCGTGQHVLMEAVQYPKAKFLCIDLSLRSLAYASLKLEQTPYNSNVNFMQGDILELKSLKRRFHVVECAGVLHHMKDPMAGWRILTDCLRPGGLMRIGLYSQAARREITEAREAIATGGYGESLEEIRRFRKYLSENNRGFSFRNFTDYYSTSSCRDLLFHRQEHQFTIPMIQEALQKLGLTFLGFLHEANILNHYHAQFRDDMNIQKLEHWRILEEQTPSLFAGMYQFWCYKPL